ncbi:MAG: CCA tRNA nucleotidyltransferase [Maricaulaceae bacterium]
MAALAEASPEPARFVGGCVRNALRGDAVDDVDIATPLPPQSVLRALEAAGLKAIPTGLEHGTVTAVSDGDAFEITTLRKDVETDGRRAVVAFTADWAEDAGRRDFRLNAIYADAAGVLYDPVGGVEDALAGRVVFIGDAETRIREDYLRILRFFRFFAWYGAGAPDAVGLEACAALTGGLAQLSVERVWKELKKLLAAPHPVAGVEAMAGAGVLRAILPEAESPAKLKRLHQIEHTERLSPDPILRLLALLPRSQGVGKALADRLKLSNDEAFRLDLALRPDPELTAQSHPRAIKAALYAFHAQAVADRLLLEWAKAPDHDVAAWRAHLATVEHWERPVFPLSGEDLMAAGLTPGPRMGAALKALEGLWIRSEFTADKDRLMAALPLLAGRGGA